MTGLERIDYRLHLLGDIHIGSGVGLPGVLDEYAVRDQEDFAYAPFSGVKGLVRDSCTRLMGWLDRLGCPNHICAGQASLRRGQRASPREFCAMASSTGGLCAVCSLFGSPLSPGSWWFSPATYPGAYRRAAAAHRPHSGGAPNALAWRDSTPSAHAAIDPRTKRAADDQLYQLETVRAPGVGDRREIIWEGRIVRDAIGSPAATALGRPLVEGWLVAALLATRAIGGRRRRGWGRCRFELAGDSQPGDDILEGWLKVYAPEPDKKTPGEAARRGGGA